VNNSNIRFVLCFHDHHRRFILHYETRVTDKTFLSIISNMKVVRSHSILICLIAIFYINEVKSDKIPFDTIVCFGDSNSDTGNVYNLTGHKWPPSPPYYQGRFSNGPVWIENLGIPNLINYAYGSATTDNNLITGVTEFNTVVPGVRQQISMYKNSTDMTKVNFARTIYVIWAGENDYYFNSSLLPYTVIPSLISGINDLILIGSKHFLIVNEPPLQAYPALFALNNSQGLGVLTNLHNNVLSSSIQTLQSNFSSISFQIVDVYSLITNILTNSSAYAINNINNCWTTLNNTIIQSCSTPNTYLFIDEYHFTTRVHQFIAGKARQLLLTSNAIINSSHFIFLIFSFFISFYSL
jgi:phospholipase/lecithinase/hemolysin